MRVFLSILLMGFVSCSDSEDEGGPQPTIPQELAGTWEWSITLFDCQVLSGVLNTQQDFRLAQSGNQVTASFTDSRGNEVEISGPVEDDRWQAVLRVESPEGRVITANMSLRIEQSNLEDLISGPIDVDSDSAMLCPAGSSATVELTRVNNPDEREVFSRCGAVDIVVAMDTSGSMDDEAQALCVQADGVLARLASLGLENARIFKWGIVQDRNDPEFQEDGVFPCLENHVKRVFGDPVVPGTDGDRLTDPSDEGDEDWADAVAVVANLGSEDRSSGFQWRPEVTRIMVPISDEGPSKGDPPDEPDDLTAIENAITQANTHEVIVSPLIANNARPLTAEFGRRLGEETGGRAARTVDPQLDLGRLLNDIVFQACGGEIQPLPDPPPAGPTTLIAGDAQGALYLLGADEGSERQVATIDVETPGTAPLGPIDGMVFNERLGQLWLSAQTLDAEGSADINLLVSVDENGMAFAVAEDDGDRRFDLAQSRRSQLIMASDDDDDLDVVGSIDGQASPYADDIESIAETGNGLAFAGDDLLLASGQELWSIDPFSGTPTLISDLTIENPPTSVADFLVVSMTARPADDQLFVLLAEDASEGAATHVGRLDGRSGVITLVRQTSVPMDGLSWLPANYFD
ncbi:MAG: hypothetical protein AAGD10_09960 [Myxococcota bacterium]